MKFGDIPLDDAAGAILAHSVRLDGGTIRKGTVLGPDDITRLRDAGLETVTAARLEDGDLGENEASFRIAEALACDGLVAKSSRTGRANLLAGAAGVLEIDAARIDEMNAVDEAITIATLRPFDAAAEGQVVATIKVITFGVASDKVRACIDIACHGGPPLRLSPFRSISTGFLQTTVPGLKDSVIDKADATMGARLAEIGLSLDLERRCAHETEAVRAALTDLRDGGCEIALVLGASAIVDRRDTVPEALRLAGGEIEHLGMPVDPGHLTLLARLDGMRVIGIPGSARSPRLHGFDWILQRLAAGIDVTPADLTRMGVGGLLKEVPGRPMPREHESEHMTDDTTGRIGALILAAGQSRRMGRVNKLLAEVDGEPMIVHAARALLASRAGPVVVVLGHDPENVRAALAGLDVAFVENPDYADGLSTSLRAGLDALPADIDGAVIALGDMPVVTPADIDALIDAFDPAAGHTICVPTHGGKRGNPVLWGRRYFAEMSSVSGDVGARHLIGENADQVFEVPLSNPGVLIDLDTPEALAAHRTGVTESPAGE